VIHLKQDNEIHTCKSMSFNFTSGYKDTVEGKIAGLVSNKKRGRTKREISF